MEYSTPIRIRWDLDFRGRVGRSKRIARRIREAAPLFVELRIEGEAGLSTLPAVFAEIHKCTPRFETTVKLFPGAASVARRGYPVDFIWEVDAREPFPRMLPDGARAISFVPDEDTLPDLPEVIEDFAESGLEALHLPNINAVRALAVKGHVPIPRTSQLREAAERIRSRGLPLVGKRLVVHDFTLWRILREIFPNVAAERVEFSGCQAGSALGHVDWEGNVYPCDSLPVLLGNLQETPFEKIWDSPGRRQILTAIRTVPDPCRSCEIMNSCLSGCRGMAYSADGSLDSPDPSCPIR